MSGRPKTVWRGQPVSVVGHSRSRGRTFLTKKPRTIQKGEREKLALFSTVESLNKDVRNFEANFWIVLDSGTVETSNEGRLHFWEKSLIYHYFQSRSNKGLFDENSVQIALSLISDSHLWSFHCIRSAYYWEILKFRKFSSCFNAYKLEVHF